MTLRSCLRWKPTGKIFRTVGLRWVPTGKIFTPSTTKVDSEPPNGSNAYITNQYESVQTLDVSAGSGYQQKDRKPSQNDKTEHGMEKTVQNQGQSPKKSMSKSIQKNQQSNRSRN
ncbi:hypothetical protein Tco_0607860 [Tanacetum coccineum]